jgi:hypothetical protein
MNQEQPAPKNRIAVVPDRCAAGREITRDQPYLGLDFSHPCEHPVGYAIHVAELGDLGLCPCHYAALDASGALEAT